MLVYTDEGYGQAIVLLHGFCEDKSLWQYFQNELSKDFRVICPDLPGFGDSPLAEGNTIEAYAKEVADLIRQLSLGKAVVIGHSLGGYVALALAESNPKLLAGLGLFHSTAYADGEEKKANRNKTIEFLNKHGLSTFIDTFAPSLFHDKSLKSEIAQVAAMGKNTQTASAIGAMEAMRERKDRTGILKRLEIPVMYIVGKEDQAVSLNSSLNQLSLPKECHALLLEGVGHVGMLEAPDKCLGFVRSFGLRCF